MPNGKPHGKAGASFLTILRIDHTAMQANNFPAKRYSEFAVTGTAVRRRLFQDFLAEGAFIAFEGGNTSNTEPEGASSIYPGTLHPAIVAQA